MSAGRLVTGGRRGFTRDVSPSPQATRLRRLAAPSPTRGEGNHGWRSGAAKFIRGGFGTTLVTGGRRGFTGGGFSHSPVVSLDTSRRPVLVYRQSNEGKRTMLVDVAISTNSATGAANSRLFSYVYYFYFQCAHAQEHGSRR